MKIKNLAHLKKDINHSAIGMFIIIFSSALIGLFLTHSKFTHQQALLSRQEIITTGNTYKANLTEKLSIIASSTVFLDFLHSGSETRKRLYPQFLLQLSTLKTKSITGMRLVDLDQNTIFNYGDPAPLFITLRLCYMNQNLDSDMGACKYEWILYFDRLEILKEILSLNRDVILCKDCENYGLISGKMFGNFHIANHSIFKLNVTMNTKKDYFFYVYFALMTLTLLSFGIWNWQRLTRLLNNYIVDPIHNLTNCLKTNNHFTEDGNIDEIKYLINEINIWKSKITKIKSDENAAKLSKIAAQLAHDVRSPLAAIDMLIKTIKDIPENYRLLLRNATQRISDIANNFLFQYKKPESIELTSSIDNEHIPSILESIISEKRSQYREHDIEIALSIAHDAWGIFSHVNSIEFKRALSNLINNAIESISQAGCVNVSLSKSKNYLTIEVNDNGCGIPEDVLPTIMAGGTSIGKRNGSGLGLSHAKTKIEEWQGNLDIQSAVDIGTIVNLHLPCSSTAPVWFKEYLLLPLNLTICILDDDFYTHQAWEDRFNKIKPSSILVKNFLSLEKMDDVLAQRLPSILYLIDYDFGHHSLNGVDLIEKFCIQDNAVLVTNRYDDVAIQKRCISAGINIIPKSFIPYIPIYLDKK